MTGGNPFMGPTEALVQYVVKARYEDLPEEVVEKSKWILLDSIGCALAGAQTKMGRVVMDQVKALGGKNESTVFGKRIRTNSVWAGYCNAILMDALDYEETALAHPCATIIPAGFAVGEAVGATGRNLILSIVLGFEVSQRIGLAVLPSPEVGNRVAVFFAFHSFGACVAGGKLMRLSPPQMLNAFGYTGATTPVPTWISRWERPLHWVKNDYGEQTRAGILGVLLSKRGFIGPQKVLDGDLGFWRMVGSDRFDPEEATRDLKASYRILNDTFKPYPACRWFHAALDGLQEIMAENSFSPAEVEKITVKTFKDAADLLDYRPKALVDGEFSLPYGMAMVLLRKKPGPSWYSVRNLRSAEAAAAMAKVTTEVDPEAERRYVHERRLSATVHVRLRTGREFTRKVAAPRGDMENPMSEKELLVKFTDLAGAAIKKKAAVSRLREMILNLEGLKNIRDLTSLLYRSCS
jgi:2-methylcitrate dehydratase PrpD